MLFLLPLELGICLLCLQGGIAAPTPKPQDVHLHLHGFTKGKKTGLPGLRGQQQAFRGNTGGISISSLGGQISGRQSAGRPPGTGMPLQESEKDSGTGMQSSMNSGNGMQSSQRQSSGQTQSMGNQQSEGISARASSGMGMQSSSGNGMQSSQSQSLRQTSGMGIQPSESFSARGPAGMGSANIPSGMGMQNSQRQSFGQTSAMNMQPSGNIPARMHPGMGMQSSMNSARVSSGMGMQTLHNQFGQSPNIGIQHYAGGPTNMGMQTSQRQPFGQSPGMGMQYSGGGNPFMGTQSLARQSAVIPQATGRKSFDRFPAVPQNMGMQSSMSQSAIMSPSSGIQSERMPSVPQSMGMQSSARQNIVMNQANANGIQSPMSPGTGMQSQGIKPGMQGMQSIVMQSNGMSQAKGKQSSGKKPVKKPTGSKGQESDRQAPGKMVQQPSGHWEWVKD